MNEGSTPPFQGGVPSRRGRVVVTLMLHSNTQKQKAMRKLLRHNATPQEIILWARLRNSQLGFKFRRQFSVDNFILDFYCPEKRLAIEIDGSQHIDSTADDERTKSLNAQGIQVLRFWNNEVNTNVNGVLLKIGTTLQEKRTTTP